MNCNEYIICRFEYDRQLKIFHDGIKFYKSIRDHEQVEHLEREVRYLTVRYEKCLDY